MITVILRDEQQTLAFAAAFCAVLPAACVIYLNGELGAGKTCFSRGLLRGYGYQGAVKSPTYTLVEMYQVDNRCIYHFDLYRLADPEELEYMGMRDYFAGQSIILVEWPQRGEGWLPKADLVIELKYQDNGRQAVVHAGSDKGESILKSLIMDERVQNFIQA